MNIYCTTEHIVKWFLIHLSCSVVEINNYEFHSTVKIKAAFIPKTPFCPTFQRELRHIPQHCNYITFFKDITWNSEPNMSAVRNSPSLTILLQNLIKRKKLARNSTYGKPLYIVTFRVNNTTIYILQNFIAGYLILVKYTCTNMHHVISSAYQF